MFSIAIYWERDNKMTMRSFTAENTYSTEAEADLHGIAYGQQIAFIRRERIVDCQGGMREPEIQ
jgi:hypothetical protein